MPLRRKLLTIELGLILLIVGFLFIGCLKLVLRDIRVFETERTKDYIIPSVYNRLVTLEQKDLSTKTSDWAKWQETSRFVQSGGKDQTYIEDNLEDPIPFESMYIHVMLFFDRDGRFLYGKGLDPDTHQDLPVPQSLAKLDPALIKSVTYGSVEHREGYWREKNQVYLVSLQQIIDPKEPKIIQGVLLVARQFTPAYQARLQEREIYDLTFYIENHRDIKQPYIHWEDDAVVGYLSLEGFNKDTVAQVAIKVGGRVSAMLNHLLWLLSVMIVMAVLLLSLPSLWLWNVLFLRPFSALVKNIQAIGQQKDLKARLPLNNSDDEFNLIAKAINTTLDSLEHAKQVEEREGRLRRILDNADTGILTSIDDTITKSNPAMARILGLDDPDALIGKTFSSFFDDPKEGKVMINHLREYGFIEKARVVLKRQDGSLVYGRYRALAIHKDGQLLIEGYFTDLTAIYIAQQKLDGAYRYYSEIFNQASEGIAVFDTNGKVHEVNEAFLDLVGVSRDVLLNNSLLSWQSFMTPDDLIRVKDMIKKSIIEKNTHRFEMSLRRPDGQVLQLLVSYTPLIRQAGWEEDRVLGIYVNITELKRLQRELERLSFNDTLTGLYNRAFFEKEISRLSKRRKGSLAVVMVDIDHLKTVNDTLGHGAGDALIQGAAQVLAESFRVEDIVARIGGDEFVVLLTDIEEDSMQSVLNRLKTNIEKVQEMRRYSIFSLSVGAAWRKTPCDIDDLIKEADQKMYADKAEHKRQRGQSVVINLTDKWLS